MIEGFDNHTRSDKSLFMAFYLIGGRAQIYINKISFGKILLHLLNKIRCEVAYSSICKLFFLFDKFIVKRRDY